MTYIEHMGSHMHFMSELRTKQIIYSQLRNHTPNNSKHPRWNPPRQPAELASISARKFLSFDLDSQFCLGLSLKLLSNMTKLPSSCMMRRYGPFLSSWGRLEREAQSATS